MQLFQCLSFVALFGAALASVEESNASCSNVAQIGDKNQNYVKQGCVKSKSKGWASSHNCYDKGGTAYLCVQGDVTTCISGKANVKSANLENGECFL